MENYNGLQRIILKIVSKLRDLESKKKLVFHDKIFQYQELILKFLGL